MASKDRSPPKPRSTCYIERLPTEIANLICRSVDEKDVLSLRLVSQFWNNVATLLMPRDVNLSFKPESLQRLLDISRHPIISQHITSLYYAPNVLTEYVTQDAWEKMMVDDYIFERFEAVPSPNASKREFRVWRRNSGKTSAQPRQRYSRYLLKKAYIDYTRMCAEQNDLRDKGYGLEELSNAISRLPNLSEICMKHGSAISQRVKGTKSAFVAGLTNAGGTYCGFPYMHSLLLAVHEADIKLHVLRLGTVDWKFLQQSNETLEPIKKTFSHLTTLQLSISTGMDEEGDEMGVELPSCRAYLSKSTKLTEFLAAAPYLKYLAIGFDWDEPFCPAELKQIFGHTLWPCLESISLMNVDATSANLNRFFEQHVPTLRHATLRTIVLLDATWVDVLENMRKVLKLESAHMRGFLLGEIPYQCWNLEPGDWSHHNDLQSGRNRTRKAIQNYLVRGGSCPLTDEVAHPQRYL